MTVTIDLPLEMETRLRERAAQSGQSVENYVRALVEQAILRPNGPAGAGTTFAEILAPVHRAFRDSGMSEEELNDLLQENLQESRRGRPDEQGRRR